MSIYIECSHDRTINLANTVSLSAGNNTAVFALDECSILSGDDSFIQCRHNCTITVGANSKIDAGNYSTVQAGADSYVIVGPGSNVTAGDGTEIRFTWWLGNTLEVTVARIGQNGILPETPYQILDGRVTVIN